MTSNTNTPSFNFSNTSVNPSDLKPHPLLDELGYANKSDSQFAEMMKYFDHYEHPVIDSENNVITHWVDVRAAIENCKKAIDCYTVEMNFEQLRRFILLKHKYNVKNLIASFKTAKYYEDYLTNDADGIQLAMSLTGTTREKIALLMHTSDATIKRLKEVGEKKLDKLGLIEQGYTSFKQVTDEIKAERLAAATAAKKAANQNKPDSPPVEEPVNKEYYEENKPASITDLPEPVYTESKDTEEYYEETEETKDTENTKDVPLGFTGGFFTIAGLGKFEMSVTNNVPSVLINGKEIPNMSYTAIADQKEINTAHSFVLSQPGKNAFCIQLTIENIFKAA